MEYGVSWQVALVAVHSYLAEKGSSGHYYGETGGAAVQDKPELCKTLDKHIDEAIEAERQSRMQR